MFNGLTNIGKEYIAKCLAENKPITFTKVKIGDGLLDLDENAELLTDVKSLKKEVEILDKTQEGELTTLTILLDNSDIEVGYYPREIGIYVTDDGIEKLYWYINDGLETQWLCAANKYPIKFKQIINLMTTNLESVIVNWSGKDLFVDREFVEEKIKEKVRTFEIPTIAELQSRKNLKVGDIVEILGYYTAGDGAGHKRIIANEDDGSGVQLKNGLWGNICHETSSTFVIHPQVWGVIKENRRTTGFVESDYQKAKTNAEGIRKAIKFANKIKANKVIFEKCEFPICYYEKSFFTMFELYSDTEYDFNGSKIWVMFDSDNASPFMPKGENPITYWKGYVFRPYSSAKNIAVRNLELIGDRYCRSYRVLGGNGDNGQEQTYGFMIDRGAKNVRLENLIVHGFMGDSLMCGLRGGTDSGRIWNPTFSLGGLSDVGVEEESDTKYRTDYLTLTDEMLECRTITTITEVGYSAIIKSPYSKYTLYWFDENKAFISKEEVEYLDTTQIPKIAKYIKALLNFDKEVQSELTKKFDFQFIPYQTEYLTVYNCEFFNNNRGGISNLCSNSLIDNCYIHDNSVGEKNGWKNFPDTTRYAINCEDVKAKNIVIRNCIIQSEMNGILMQTYTCKIQGNTIEGAGICLYEPNHYAIITNNNIKGGSIVTPLKKGRRIDTILISNNTCIDTKIKDLNSSTIINNLFYSTKFNSSLEVSGQDNIIDNNKFIYKAPLQYKIIQLFPGCSIKYESTEDLGYIVPVYYDGAFIDESIGKILWKYREMNTARGYYKGKNKFRNITINSDWKIRTSDNKEDELLEFYNLNCKNLSYIDWDKNLNSCVNKTINFNNCFIGSFEVACRFLETDPIKYTFNFTNCSFDLTTKNITQLYFDTVKVGNLSVTFKNCKFYNAGSLKDTIGTKTLENYCTFIGCEFSNLNPPAIVKVEKLNTLYYEKKMESEGGTVLNDYYSYLDEKHAYENLQLKINRDKQEAYELLLQENPKLTYEEFEKEYTNNPVMKLNLTKNIEKPKIPETVKEFMKKYL